MDIAERMRDRITRDNWIQGSMWDIDRRRACLLGHYSLLMGQSIIFDAVATPYLLRLHEIIGEQYPEAVDAWLTSDFRCDAPGLIVWFNDRYAAFEDIQAVLEKAAA